MRKFLLLLAVSLVVSCGHFPIVPGVAVVTEKPANMDVQFRPCDAYEFINVGGWIGSALAMVNVALCPEDPVPVVEAGVPGS